MKLSSDEKFAEKLSEKAFEIIRKELMGCDHRMLTKELTRVVGILCVNLLGNLLKMHSEAFVTTNKKKQEIFDDMLASIVRSLGGFELTKETIQ